MRNMIDEATQVKSQRAADEFIEKLVRRDLGADPALGPAQAEHAIRSNIAWAAADHSNEVRERVERLYRTAHPIFGSIRLNGPPTREQALKLGLVYGNLSRAGAVNAREIVAQLPRLDERRARLAPAPPSTGICARALGLDGTWGTHDISLLACESLLRFTRSHGGRNAFAESLVLTILGHEVPDSLHGVIHAVQPGEDEP